MVCISNQPVVDVYFNLLTSPAVNQMSKLFGLCLKAGHKRKNLRLQELEYEDHI